MLRRLARWPGSRILLLWTALVVIEGGLLLYFRAPDEPPAHIRRSTNPIDSTEANILGLLDRDPALYVRESVDSQSSGDGGVPPGFQKSVDEFPMLLDSIFAPLWRSVSEHYLSPRFILLLALLAAVVYGPPLALAVLTVMWLVARRRYGTRLPL